MHSNPLALIDMIIYLLAPIKQNIAYFRAKLR